MYDESRNKNMERERESEKKTWNYNWKKSATLMKVNNQTSIGDYYHHHLSTVE